MGDRYDTVLDSGLFYVLDDDDRPAYVASLATFTRIEAAGRMA